MKSLIMGTRGSALALAQSRAFARALEAAHPGLVVEERWDPLESTCRHASLSIL